MTKGLNPLYFGSLVPTWWFDLYAECVGLNPLYFGSLVPTPVARAPWPGNVLIPFISGLWFLPVRGSTSPRRARLNPLYFGSLVPTCRFHGSAAWRKRLNPLYFGSLVPTAGRCQVATHRQVLIPFISGLWFLLVDYKRKTPFRGS